MASCDGDVTQWSWERSGKERCSSAVLLFLSRAANGRQLMGDAGQTSASPISCPFTLSQKVPENRGSMFGGSSR